MSTVIELMIDARQRPVAQLMVARTLPTRLRRMVGPFVFFDQMGPASLEAGTGVDVAPHPHIGLSTVTTLFQGSMRHLDSLGSDQLIVPGEVNWMNAGRGIVHSERTPTAVRASGQDLYGLQLWVACPTEYEEAAPSFAHHGAEDLPRLEAPGVTGTLLAGEAYGLRAAVEVLSPLHYVNLNLEAGATFELPSEHPERALYVLSGEVSLDHEVVGPQQMAVIAPGRHPTLRAAQASHVVLIGGEPLGHRYLFWNFVASSQERIREAAHAWQAREFPAVPGDDGYTELKTLPTFNFR